MQKEYKADVVILGGSLGGCAAALAAGSIGGRVRPCGTTRLPKNRHNPCDQRSIPASSGGMEHRGGGRIVGRLCPGSSYDTAGGTERKRKTC